MTAKHEVNEVQEAVTQTTDPAGSPSCLMNVLFRGGSLKTKRCAAFLLCFSFFFVEKNRRNCCYTAIVKKRVWLSLCHSCTQHSLTFFFFTHQLEEQNQHLREQNQKCNEQLELLRSRLRQLSQNNSSNSKNHRASTEV